MNHQNVLIMYQNGVSSAVCCNTVRAFKGLHILCKKRYSVTDSVCTFLMDCFYDMTTCEGQGGIDKKEIVSFRMANEI